MTLNVGDTVHFQDASVPIGTVVLHSGNRYIREADGWWQGRHVHWPVNLYDTATNEVVEVSDWTETLAQFKQRFALGAVWAANYNGGGGYYHGAKEVLEHLGLDDPESERLRVGSWVHANVNLTLVPDGSLLLSGNPKRAEGHTMYVKRGGRVLALAGPRVRDDIMMRVVALPSHYRTEPWPEPEPNETELLHQFMREVWRLGMDEKHSRGWCPMFEASMVVLGLSEEVIRSLPGSVTELDLALVGSSVVDHDQLHALPAGTVLVDDPHNEGWCARKNDNGTWGVGYNGPDGLFRDATWNTEAITVHPGLTIHSLPVRRAFPCGAEVSADEVASMPVGAVVRWTGQSGLDAIMARTNGERAARNRCGTESIIPEEQRHLGNAGAYSISGLIVVWDGVSPIRESHVHDRTELALMPVGTVIGQNFNPDGTTNYSWTKTEPDLWVHNTRYGINNARSAEFAIDPLRYMYIPVPGVPAPAGLPTTPLDSDEDEF